jgi:hypothetical protein
MAAAATVYDHGSVYPSESEVIDVNLTWPVSPGSPHGYDGGAFAGLESLTVNGENRYGFCIDLYHYSVDGGPLNYTVNSLGSSPTASPPGAMGAATATFISELWAQYYSANMGAAEAAGLQVAIWSLVVPGASVSSSSGMASPIFTWLTSGGSTASVKATAQNDIAFINTEIADGQTPAVAELQAINPSKYGQAFVIDSVPDGGSTARLLAMGLVCLGSFSLRSRERFCRQHPGRQ